MLGGGRQQLVFDVDQLAGILGDITAIGDYHRDRLTDIAHPIDRESGNRPPALDHLGYRPDQRGELARR